MADEKKNSNISIFQGVKDAIDGNKRRSPEATGTPSHFTPQNAGIIQKGNPVEEIQQQYLDWQSTKVAHNLYQRSIYFDTDRIGAYMDYRAMDQSPEVAAALDILRDECLTLNAQGNILEIYSENSRVKEVLKDLFLKRLNIDFNLKLWIRDLIKFGDYFVKLSIAKGEGIYDYITLPVEECHREEGFDGKPENTRFRWETTNDYFEDWQVAHFRLLEDTRRIPYGRSILDPARKLWKQLQLAEDSMLTYRIIRAPERRVFYIEVGTLEANDVKQYIMQVQNAIKKQPVVSTANGSTSMKYNPMNVSEDYFIPIRGDKSSRIDTLPGACLALNTKIKLLDGRCLELKDIIKEHESGKKLWSYSIDPSTGTIVPGMITSAAVTRKNAEVLKITLDNGKEIVCTPDHKFDVRLGGIKQAKDLVEGESLWSFNTQLKPIRNELKRNNYEMVYDHKKQTWLFTHRIVASYFKKIDKHQELVFNQEYKDCKKTLVHHDDKNRFNNSPENLFYMYSPDHRELHAKDIEIYSKMGYEAYLKKYNTDPEFKSAVDANLEKSRKEYYQNRTEDQEFEHNKAISEGVLNYFKNLDEAGKKERGKISAKNAKKGSASLQNIMNTDPEFKRKFYEKTSKTLTIVKNTPEFKAEQSERSKKYWDVQDYKERVFENQTYKYSQEMLKILVEYLKQDLDGKEILVEINKPGSHFMNIFLELNKGNRQLKKMKHGFTPTNLKKLANNFGYEHWRDLKNKIPLYNHTIIKIEYLSERMDTGTITIDGQEKYHNFHNFALEVGVFTRNSNLSDIADIVYLEKKLFASLKVPKAYLNYVDELPGGNLLSQADIRFARTINTIQQFVLLELRRIANIHLYFAGYEDDIDNFTLSLTNPSTQQELLKLETMKARLEVAAMQYTPGTVDSFFSWSYVLENTLGISKADIKLILKQKKVEKKIFAEIDSAISTYKKIGLFADIDSKYELPPDQQGATDEDGDPDKKKGGAPSGGGGGFDLGGGNEEIPTPEEAAGGLPPGGGSGAPGEALGGGAGGEGATGTPGAGNSPAPVGGVGAAPGAISEQNKNKGLLRKVLKESTKRFDEYLDELIQDETPTIVKEESEFIKDNVVSNFRTKKLIESMESALDRVKDIKSSDRLEIKSSLLEEVKKKNSLLESGDVMNNNVNDLIAKLGKLYDDKTVSEGTYVGSPDNAGSGPGGDSEQGGGGEENSGSGPGGDSEQGGSGEKTPDDKYSEHGGYTKSEGNGGDSEKGGDPLHIAENIENRDPSNDDSENVEIHEV